MGNLRQVIKEIFFSTPFAAVLLTLGFALSVTLCACGDDDYEGGPQKLTGPLSLVQLGDSVASGEGTLYGLTYNTTERIWNPPAVDWPVWYGEHQQCHSSEYAYAFVVSKMLQNQGWDNRLTTFACSGASYKNGIATDEYLCPDAPDKDPWFCPKEQEVQYRPAQFGDWDTKTDLNNAYDLAEPDIVFITSGANDVEFEYILLGCEGSVLFPHIVDCKTGGKTEEKFLNDLDEFETNYKRLIEQIKERGQAVGKVPKVVFTSYHDPFPDPETESQQIEGCWDLGVLSVDPDKITFLRSLLSVFNKRIEKVVSDYANDESISVVYVDIQDVLNGHEWCTDDPWAYGLTALIWDDFKCKAPFHPTPEGQKAIAQMVYDAILPMLEYK